MHMHLEYLLARVCVCLAVNILGCAANVTF